MSMATDDTPTAAASVAKSAQPHRPSIPVWCSSTSTVPVGSSATKPAAGRLMPSPVSLVTVPVAAVRSTFAQWSAIDIVAGVSEPSSDPVSGSSSEQPASSAAATTTATAHRTVARTRSR
jgi:hypothetical protein